MNCEEVNEIYYKYIYITISSFGLCLNILCSIAFYFSYQLRNAKTNLFRYLRVKSVCDTITMIRNIFDYTYYYAYQIQFNYSHPTVGWCRFYIFFYYYVGAVVLLLSILCEVAANFNRYRTMTNKFKMFDKIDYKIKISLMISYCLLFYSYRFFNFKCIDYVYEPSNSLEETNDTNISISLNVTSNSSFPIYYE